MCTNPGIKKYLAIYVGLWNYCPSDVGCHEETKCQGLNLHKPRILTHKSNDIFKCGSSFKIKLINHLSF